MELADALTPGFRELHPAVKASVKRLMILGLPIRFSVQSKIKLPNIVSIIVMKFCSF